MGSRVWDRVTACAIMMTEDNTRIVAVAAEPVIQEAAAEQPLKAEKNRLARSKRVSNATSRMCERKH